MTFPTQPQSVDEVVAFLLSNNALSDVKAECARRTPNTPCCCAKRVHDLDVFFRCETCQTSPNSCICAACFRNGNHEGHRVHPYVSSGFATCDCGTPLWKKEGCCPHHGPDAPPDVLGLLPASIASFPARLEQALTFLGDRLSSSNDPCVPLVCDVLASLADCHLLVRVMVETMNRPALLAVPLPEPPPRLNYHLFFFQRLVFGKTPRDEFENFMMALLNDVAHIDVDPAFVMEMALHARLPAKLRDAFLNDSIFQWRSRLPLLLQELKSMGLGLKQQDATRDGSRLVPTLSVDGVEVHWRIAGATQPVDANSLVWTCLRSSFCTSKRTTRRAPSRRTTRR